MEYFRGHARYVASDSSSLGAEWVGGCTVAYLGLDSLLGDALVSAREFEGTVACGLG